MVLTDEEKSARREYYKKNKKKIHEQQKKYRDKPENKEKKKKQDKIWRDKPENKEKTKKYNKIYHADYDKLPKAKARKAAQYQKVKDNPERKKKKKEYSDEYYARPETIKKKQTYRDDPKNKLRAKIYHAKPEVKAILKIARDENRLKVLQYYSQLLSKSNTPCCNCCGINSHIKFLAIDHIAGKRQMDTEPELKKLKYTSELGGGLVDWIIKNNFPKGFQILCHSCNHSKGHSEDNKCPLENKPH